MLRTKTLKLFTFILISSSLSRLQASPGEPLPPPPSLPPVHQLDCDDITPAAFANHKYRNPMKTIYRPSTNYAKAMNRKFYALYKMDADGKIPVYAWYQKYEGFECVASYIQRFDYFSPWGCYQGSVCSNVNIVQERSSYVLVERWISFKNLCKEMSAKQNPDNDPRTQNDYLEQMITGNLYGFYADKGMPDDIAFTDKYFPAVQKSNQIHNYEWEAANNAAGNSVQPAPKPIPLPQQLTEIPTPDPQPQALPPELEIKPPAPMPSAPKLPVAAVPAPITPPPAAPALEQTSPQDPPVQIAKDDTKAPKYPALEAPLGIPAKGQDGLIKPGFFYSPNDKDTSGNPILIEGHIIDLRGVPSGKIINDPWNNKMPIKVP